MLGMLAVHTGVHAVEAIFPKERVDGFNAGLRREEDNRLCSLAVKT